MLETRIELCGELVVQIQGRRCEAAVPGPRGRLLLAYLVWNRRRAVPRDELIGALWPVGTPASPEGALSTLLARLRRAIGDDAVSGRSQLTLALGNASVDVEDASELASRASAIVATAPADSLLAARQAAAILEAPLLPGIDVPWLAERRRELDELLTRTLETQARAALLLGGKELSAAEAAARQVIEREPYRESAYVLAMEAAAANGNVATALVIFDELRRRLRDDLGTSPARSVVALHERLVRSAEEISIAVDQLPADLAHSATRVVARTAELDRLRARWRQAASGTLQLALLEGEPGVGKTALLAAIAREAGAALYGRAEENAVVPYQPLLEAVRQAVQRGGVPSLPTAQRAELARLVPEIGGDAPTDGDFDLRRYALFEAVSAVIRDTTVATPVLLAIDDLHWADGSTLLLLRHLLRRAQDSKLFVVATIRVGEGLERVLEESVAELERRGVAERMILGALDTDGVGALIATRVGGETEPAIVETLHRRTGGNPLFIEETLRGLDAPTAEALAEAVRRGRVPDAVKAVVVRRAAAMGPAASVLEFAAVIGRRFRLRTLEAAYDGPARVAVAVDEAVRRELLFEESDGDGLVFVHALVGEALYEHQSATRRARTHARIAEALENDRTANVGEVAHHFFHARHVVGTDRAVSHCIAAAEDATARLAHDDAALHYGRALEALEDEAQRPRLLLAYAEALERGGDLLGSRHRYREAAEAARASGAGAEQFARAALGFAKYQEYGVVDTDAIELLEEALGNDVGTAYRARLAALLAVRVDRIREQPTRESLFDQALAAARASGDRETLGAVLAQAPFISRAERVRERLATAGEAITIAVETRQPELELSARVTRFVALLTIGDMAEAHQELADYTELADRTRHPWSQWYARMLAATTALLSGDVDRGRELSAEALERRRIHEPDATELDVVQSVMAAVVAKDPKQIDLDRVRSAADEFGSRPGWRALYAFAAAINGQCDICSVELDRYRHDEFDFVRRAPDVVNALALLGESAALIEDVHAAAPLYSALLPFADFNVVMDRGWAAWGSASRQLSLLARLLGDADAAERHNEDARRQNRALGATPFVDQFAKSAVVGILEVSHQDPSPG